MAPPFSKTQTGARPPTSEIGAVLNGAFSPAGMAPWTRFVDLDEYVPELIWPSSVRTFERMRTDTQLASLFQATALAIRRFKWSIDPNGADEAMVVKISKDYNLPIQGEKVNMRLRDKRRFAFDAHQRKAMYAGIYGHYFFEQVGEISRDDQLWHLRKLAERPPRTISDFRVSADGGLISIIQNVFSATQYTNGALPTIPEIPVDRLVGYVWEQEGANWVGRSWFRDCYKNWLIKDRLMRIDAVNHERAGGVPYIEAHPGATMDEIEQLNKMARGFRIGDTAGGAVPAGAKLNIARGTNSSVVESIKYHDEAMARRFMLMVMQLGQTQTGSRALGSTFIDFWAHGLSAIATWFADTFNEHVIEDDIDWNYGEDVDQVPRLMYEYDPEFVVQDLAQAIVSSLIVVDDELEAYARKEMGLPDKDKATARPLPTATLGDGAGSGGDNPSVTAPKSGAGGVKAGERVEGAPSWPSPSADPLQLDLHLGDAPVNVRNEYTLEPADVKVEHHAGDIHVPAPVINIHAEMPGGEKVVRELHTKGAVATKGEDGMTHVEYEYDEEPTRQKKPRAAIATKIDDNTTRIEYEYEEEEGDV